MQRRSNRKVQKGGVAEAIAHDPNIGCYRVKRPIRIGTDGCLEVEEVPYDPNAPLLDDDRIDLSDVQVLRVKMIREDRYGAHEAKQLAKLERWVARPLDGRERVATEHVTAEMWTAELKRRFGPWPEAKKDEKGRVIWHRDEFKDMNPDFANLIRKSPKVVVK